MKKILEENLNKLKEINPVIYHLTNLVTINDCANVTLAIGASPIMSFCLEEMEEVLNFSSSVVLNIGTMDKTMQEMILEVGKLANRYNKPIVLDLVGVGATKARTNLAKKILDNIKIDVIKGNMFEVKSLIGLSSQGKGVDSLDEEEDGESVCKKCSSLYNSTTVITGKTDFIGNSSKIFKVSNGHEMMKKVCGTGCMLSSIIGSFLAVTSPINAGILSCLIMGISGEKAFKNFKGISSFKANIIDEISIFDSNSFDIAKISGIF